MPNAEERARRELAARKGNNNPPQNSTINKTQSGSGRVDGSRIRKDGTQQPDYSNNKRQAAKKPNEHQN